MTLSIIGEINSIIVQIIICATYNEAIPIIKVFNLTSTKILDRLVYIDNVNNLMLIVSGVGANNAYDSTSFICENFNQNIQIINIGTCAISSSNGLILGCKIEKLDSKQCYYPDILIKNSGSYELRKIITSKTIVGKKTVSEYPHYAFDMESYYIYKAASKHIGPNLISFIKIPYDKGINNSNNIFSSLNKNNNSTFIKSQTESIDNNIDEICEILKSLRKQLSNKNGCIDFFHKENAHLSSNAYDIDLLAKKLKCSTCMKLRLEKQLKYAQVCKVDIDKMLKEVMSEYKLPIEHKKTGGVILNKIDRYLTS